MHEVDFLHNIWRTPCNKITPRMPKTISKIDPSYFSVIFWIRQRGAG
jgi:hypothetical protein